MSGFTGMILVGLILALLGASLLIFIVLKYYWGERGKPLPLGEEKRRKREEELRLRAKQIEYAKANPRATRKPDFWDNTKVFKE